MDELGLIRGSFGHDFTFQSDLVEIYLGIVSMGSLRGQFSPYFPTDRPFDTTQQELDLVLQGHPSCHD